MWALGPFICYDHPERKNGIVQRSMVSYPQVLCWDHREHLTLVILGLIGCLVGPVFLLAVCCRVTYVYSARVANGDAVFIRSYGFLFSRFQPWRYYFGLIQLTHNLLLSLTPVIIASDIAGQIMFVVIVIQSLIFCHAYFKPFRIQGGDLVHIVIP